MKRRTYTLLIVVALVMLSGFATVVATRGVQSRKKLDPEAVASFDKYTIDSAIKSIRKDNNDDLTTQIPIYNEEEILFLGEELGFAQDHYFMARMNLRFNDTPSIMYQFPTEAVRSRDEDNYYIMYQTDTGYRMYLFFNESLNQAKTPVGYPVVIGEVHSYDEFSSLRIGDSIDDVVEIDSVASLYKTFLLDYCHFNCYRAQEEIKIGWKSASIHFLSDGILKIEYTMKEEGKLEIANMEYYSEYQMKDAGERIIDYHILDIDIPS